MRRWRQLIGSVRDESCRERWSSCKAIRFFILLHMMFNKIIDHIIGDVRIYNIDRSLGIWSSVGYDRDADMNWFLGRNWKFIYLYHYRFIRKPRYSHDYDFLYRTAKSMEDYTGWWNRRTKDEHQVIRFVFEYLYNGKVMPFVWDYCKGSVHIRTKKTLFRIRMRCI